LKQILSECGSQAGAGGKERQEVEGGRRTIAFF
jgi:hypothetical protein